MPPKRQRLHSKPSTSATATVPLPDLPDHIIVSILKFLPVKSIIRFKSVSKEWLSLLSTPNFISIHREETSNNPLNHSFIIRSTDESCLWQLNYQMSLLNINSIGREPISLVNPFPLWDYRMWLVGSINGLVCLTGYSRGDMIILWNPALNLYKAISLRIHADSQRFSLGFAYDFVNDDYNIILIDSLKPNSSSPEALSRSRIEVYSASLDSWKTVHTDFPFDIFVYRSNVIVKGIPYWAGLLHQDKLTRVLVYYDMQNGSFKQVSLPILALQHGVDTRFVEWKGYLGIILFSQNRGKNDFLDFLVYDEMGMCWNKVSSHGLIRMKMEKFIQCSKNGVILSEIPNGIPRGKLRLYDPVTKGSKKFCIRGALKHSFEALGYTESLVTVKGMEKVKEQDKDKS